MSKDASGQNNGNLIIQASTVGRSATLGAQLEFVIPAGTDGTNFWGQGRILTVAGNGNTNDATGKMIIGTRRSFNKLGTGTGWYYGDDITIDGTGKVGIGTLNPNAVLDVATPISGGALGTVFARQLEGNQTGDGTYLGTTAWGTQPNVYNGKEFSIEHHFNGSKNSAINFYRGSGYTGGFITFETNNGSEQMRIDQNGNLGIGTTTPQAKLDINGASRSQSLISNISSMTDNFTHNGQTFNNYGITWVNDSWQSGSATTWLSSYGGIKLFTGGQNRLNINYSGNVGIGTANPQAMLDVSGNANLYGLTIKSNGDNYIQTVQNNKSYNLIGTYPGWDANAVYIAGYNQYSAIAGSSVTKVLIGGPNGGKTFRFDLSTGNLWINGPDALPSFADNYSLNVNGNIRGNKVVVNTNGADFVFEPGYKLAPLNQVQAFIQANHHLPGITPAAQMQKDGLDVGDNQTKLLQKIEELTLYIIEQDKKLEEQKLQQARQNEQQYKVIEAQGELLRLLQKQVQQLRENKK